MTMKITSQRTIAKVLSEASIGDRFKIMFAPIDAPIWFRENGRGEATIADTGDNAIRPQHLAVIVSRSTAVFELTHRAEDGDVCLLGDGEDMWVNEKHISTLTPMPKPTTHRVDSMTKDIVLHPDGHAVVGCQTITRKGLEQIHDLLTKHLGRG